MLRTSALRTLRTATQAPLGRRMVHIENVVGNVSFFLFYFFNFIICCCFFENSDWLVFLRLIIEHSFQCVITSSYSSISSLSSLMKLTISVLLPFSSSFFSFYLFICLGYANPKALAVKMIAFCGFGFSIPFLASAYQM